MIISRVRQVLNYNLLLQKSGDRQLILLGQAALNLRNSIDPCFSDIRDAELKVFSQWGEDGILDYICHKLGLRKPRMLEFGVGDFSECNSRFLVENRNASAVVVDSHQGLIPYIKRLDSYWKSTVVPLNEWITRANAQELLQKASLLLDGLDIFSIDLDGNDYWIMNELDLLGIRIVIVEYNPVFGPERSITVPPDDAFDRTSKHHSNLYYGASLKAWVSLMRDKGFVFVGSNQAGSNAFFLRANEAKSIGLRLPSVANLATFCDWRVRESRDLSGELSLLTGSQRWDLIKHLPFTDLTSDKI